MQILSINKMDSACLFLLDGYEITLLPRIAKKYYSC